MTRLKLCSTYINPHREILPNVMSEKEGKAIGEMLAWYSPNCPIRYSTIYNGGAGISQTVVVNNNYWDIDQVIRQAVGLPSLNLALNSSVLAGGKGFEPISSFLSCLGESIERMSGAFAFFKENLETCAGSYNSLQQAGQNAIAPEALPCLLMSNTPPPISSFSPLLAILNLVGSKDVASLAEKISGFLYSSFFYFIYHLSKRPVSAIRLLLVWHLT